jgi:hypothetical protein
MQIQAGTIEDAAKSLGFRTKCMVTNALMAD